MVSRPACYGPFFLQNGYGSQEQRHHDRLRLEHKVKKKQQLVSKLRHDCSTQQLLNFLSQSGIVGSKLLAKYNAVSSIYPSPHATLHFDYLMLHGHLTSSGVFTIATSSLYETNAQVSKV